MSASFLHPIQTMITYVRTSLVATLLFGASPAYAQQPGAPAATQTDKTDRKVETFRVVAIDHPDRIVTVMGGGRRLYSVLYRQSVAGLEDLRLDDKVTFASEEAVVTRLFPASNSVPLPMVITPGPLGPTVTIIATLTAVDANTPSVSFQTPEGGSQTLKLLDARGVQGVKAGDRVQLTYGPALMLHREPRKDEAVSK